MATREKGQGGSRRREDVGEAALELFAARGYRSTGIRDLAEALGIGATSVYSHVGSKGELLNAILQRTLAGLLAAQSDAAASTDDLTEQVRRVTESQVRYYLNHAREALVTTTDFEHAVEPEREAIFAARLEYRNNFSALIQRGVEAGAFDVSAPKVAAIAIIEMCEAIPRWYQESGDLSQAAIEYMYGDFAVRLVGGS